MNTSILFRVDASRRRGLGHLVRCRNLAEHLLNEGYNCFFLSREDDVLRNFPLPLYTVDKKESELENLLKKISPCVIVCDIKDAPPSYMKVLKKWCRLLVALDNNGKGKYIADIVINAIAKGTARTYKVEDTLFFEGISYLVLHPQFLKRERRKREGILVSLGGTDPRNLTCIILEALEGVDTKKKVVVGPHFSRKSLRRLKQTQMADKRVELLHSPSCLAPCLFGAEVVISCGGLTMYEAAAAGCATVVVCQNREQLKNAESMQEAVINLGLFTPHKKKELTEKVSLLLYNKEERERLSRECRRRVDAKGIVRVAEIIKRGVRGKDG